MPINIPPGTAAARPAAAGRVRRGSPGPGGCPGTGGCPGVGEGEGGRTGTRVPRAHAQYRRGGARVRALPARGHVAAVKRRGAVTDLAAGRSRLRLVRSGGGFSLPLDGGWRGAGPGAGAAVVGGASGNAVSGCSQSARPGGEFESVEGAAGAERSRRHEEEVRAPGRDWGRAGGPRQGHGGRRWWLRPRPAVADARRCPVSPVRCWRPRPCRA